MKVVFWWGGEGKVENEPIPLYLKLPMIIFCQFWVDPPPPIVLLYGAPFPHHFRDVPPPLLLSVQRTGIQLVLLMFQLMLSKVK